MPTSSAAAVNNTADILEDHLIQFDLDPQFGPSIGITRRARCVRALSLGKSLPPLIQKHLDDCRYHRLFQSPGQVHDILYGSNPHFIVSPTTQT